MRCIGLDVHRTFAEVAIVTNGQVHSAGRIVTTAPGLEALAKTLGRGDHVVLEATGNSYAIARILAPHVGRVVISNPLRTRAIAAAKIKTDKVDARVLAQLLAADFLPEVWMPDETTHVLRRQVARGAQLRRQRTRLKNQIHAVLHRNLIPPCPATDLFGQRGRAWLRCQTLPVDEATAVAAYLRALDVAGEELAHLDAALARAVAERPEIRRLLTVPGINIAVAAGLLAAVGDISRFASAQKLVGYVGLDPRVRQSGLQPARHGPITKQGRAHARGLLVEAAWAASRSPGPLRAFFRRICTKRGPQVAAVATARKLVILVWHMLTKEQDYLWARPSLTAHKLLRLELRAGAPACRGRRRGPAYAYNLPELRERERALTVQGERAYQRLVAHWQPRGPKATGAGATTGERR
jgi:transposase